MSSVWLSASATAVAAGALVLAGCGQKGPLYLPEKGGAVVTAPAATTPGQPSEPSPVPQPQSTAEPPPADLAPPPKKSDKDEEPQPR